MGTAPEAMSRQNDAPIAPRTRRGCRRKLTTSGSPADRRAAAELRARDSAGATEGLMMTGIGSAATRKVMERLAGPSASRHDGGGAHARRDSEGPPVRAQNAAAELVERSGTTAVSAGHCVLRKDRERSAGEVPQLLGLGADGDRGAAFAGPAGRDGGRRSKNRRTR